MAGYARVLRGAIHGAEIEDVTVRVVAPSRIRAQCGDPRAVACYSGDGEEGLIVIPSGPAQRVRATLLHEYGHHIKATTATPRWWAARRIAARLRSGQVVMDDRKGWTRSVEEIFAEDYMAMHVRGGYSIPWLPQPSATVLRALRRDLAGLAARSVPPTVPDDAAGIPRDVQKGFIGLGQEVTASVVVDTPGRTVVVLVTPDPARGVVPLEIEIGCDGRESEIYEAAAGETVEVEYGPVDPGTCTVWVNGPTDREGGVIVEIMVGRGSTPTVPPRA